ncbi:fructosamine-3-kinase [Planomicrobium sp. HSC-17F08]|nr:fructosamine-3-kinase [Planomicrobium sp. HSC-17F08]
MDESKLKAAAMHANVEVKEFIGEGAWHYAWKVQKNNNKLVLRIPKETAYGKPVTYDEEAFKAEYAGTELYYRSVNKAVEGAAPEFYQFHVSPELTYTLETFAGEQIDLYSMTEATAFQIGKEIGEIHRKTEEVPHGLDGFGYLAWSEEKGLRGSLSGDARKFLDEESEEHLADYQALCAAYSEFEDKILFQTIQLAVDLRKKSFTKPFLVNQDASPENILINGNAVCLIDPYPSIYYPRGMAGNFMNLYETYFIVLADTERYKKHRFAACCRQLKMMASGFLEGYSAGNLQTAAEVRAEQLLQLLETANIHFQLLSGDLPKEAVIRYGNKEEIKERLLFLSSELKALAAQQVKSLEDLLVEEPK